MAQFAMPLDSALQLAPNSVSLTFGNDDSKTNISSRSASAPDSSRNFGMLVCHKTILDEGPTNRFFFRFTLNSSVAGNPDRAPARFNAMPYGFEPCFLSKAARLIRLLGVSISGFTDEVEGGVSANGSRSLTRPTPRIHDGWRSHALRRKNGNEQFSVSRNSATLFRKRREIINVANLPSIAIGCKGSWIQGLGMTTRRTLLVMKGN